MIESARGKMLERSLAMTFVLLKEHAKKHPGEVDELYRALVAHVRNDRPWAVETVTP